MTAKGSAATSSSDGASNGRFQYARAIMGPELYDKVASAKILVVGAGGIGCELLKNLVLVGFGHVEIIDLDTIDLSNLNRQFLFQKVHIGKPKSLIASATALKFNPHADIKSYHANVKDTEQFGWEFFERFDVVCNALDNLDARRWVNRMCVMTGVPLVESGTTGFLGQVQPIARGQSECYDCTAKPTPKTYPVCTIRSTPSTPIHCVVWAKTYLFLQLFGAEDENEDVELDKALQSGENAEEIGNLRKEAREMRTLREAIFKGGEEIDVEGESLAERTFDKIFNLDVERLLSMEDMWRNRTKPVPLKFEATETNGAQQNGNGTSDATHHSLRDQRVLSLRESINQFSDSLTRLSRRAASSSTRSLTFDKDDDDAMDFVTATSNLRSRVYHIQPQSRFQVKEMAGNIIPAIASTNAIIAGAQVLQTMHALRRRWTDARFISLNRGGAARLLSSITLGKPNPACAVCQDDYFRVHLDVDQATIGDVKEAVLRARNQGGLGFEVDGMEIYEGTRLLADEDFDDNIDQDLASLGVRNGMTLTCIDEDGVRATLNLFIAEKDLLDTTEHAVTFGPAEKLPELRNKAIIKPPAPDSSDDDDDVEAVDVSVASTTIKRKRSADEQLDGGAVNLSSKAIAPIKRARTGADESQAIELD